MSTQAVSAVSSRCIEPRALTAAAFLVTNATPGRAPATLSLSHSHLFALSCAAILLGKGVDCTNMFESYHVFNAPVKRLAKYAVAPHSGVRRTESVFQSDLREMLRWAAVTERLTS